jgi:uncharacterized protein YeaO (DUF488 family)
MLRTKCVKSRIDRDRDGIRILATRFLVRYLRRSRYDVWMPSLGPSEKIIRARRAGRISWAKFVREYRREVVMDGPIDGRSRTNKNHGQKFTLRLLQRLAKRQNVTIMCHCAEDEDECHRHVLKKMIQGA